MSRWGLIAYIAALFGTLPLALPCWNALLRETIGRVLTVEAMHIVQYAGLGCVAAWSARDLTQPVRRLLVPLIAAIGLADELLQRVMPQRVFQWSDVWLNWAGSLLGGGFWLTLRRLRQVWG